MKRHTSPTHHFLFVLFVLYAFTGRAQDKEQKRSFSLQEAIDYALGHNQNYLNAEIDVKAAEYKNKEYTGIGFPQINGSADVKDYLSIPTSLIPGEFFGGQPGSFIPVKFGTKFNATMGISVSQIIFNSDYIVGLEAAKEFMVLSQKNVKRSKVETYADITKAYYGVILTKERLKVIDANIERYKKSFEDTKAMNAVGLTEKLDVDRLELAYNKLIAEKEKNFRGVGYTETLLKFQMGYDLEKEIVLTDEIKEDMLVDIDQLSQSKIIYEARPDYSILQSQLNINNLELKRNRYQYLPSLNAYGSMQYQAQRTTFDIFNIDKPWFNIALIGASLNVPIFNGGQKYYRIQQSKLNVQKTNNQLTFLRSKIDVDVESNIILYKNALISLETQRKNKELAKSIFEASQVKYTAGVGSNLELVYAQAEYREAEINFLNAVYDLILAKTDYLKATGTLVK
ncbi:MAG: TolC family protein [bacterium]|nr:TolC family protein [bacterium]